MLFHGVRTNRNHSGFDAIYPLVLHNSVVSPLLINQPILYKATYVPYYHTTRESPRSPPCEQKVYGFRLQDRAASQCLRIWPRNEGLQRWLWVTHRLLHKVSSGMYGLEDHPYIYLYLIKSISSIVDAAFARSQRNHGRFTEDSSVEIRE